MNRQPKAKTLDMRLEHLKVMITELQEEASLAELHNMLDEGVDPNVLLACCMAAMQRIGIRFETGSYFISALIMAGEIMRGATKLLGPYLTVQQPGFGGGRIILGTIQGDIHDLGKNLFASLLKCHGIEVDDLGVDVPARVFLGQAEKNPPDIIGISCVLTTCVENLKQAISVLKQELPETGPPIIIGGTCIDERMAAYIGAPFWVNDAIVGLRICQEILQTEGRNKSPSEPF